MSEAGSNAGELPTLPPRPAGGHKGTFGTVAVLGGSCAGDARMIGAPALAALGALRAGAGLARLVMPTPILGSGIAICPSATGVGLHVDDRGELVPHLAAEVIDDVILDSTCLVVGPGLGVGEGPAASSLRAVQQEDIPVVVDADAINNLALIPQLQRDFRGAAVLTPHPGEFRRLAAALNITLDPVNEATRPAAAEALAQRLGCIVVLKGMGTVVSDGHQTWVCTRGHPCLATAGTGDVLSGVIAGIIAQHGAGPKRVLSLFDAARIGVQAHAIAGERWAKSRGASGGLIATELAEEVPAALEGLR
ncbi:MAG TPA: NAD(P)H-hydrate dehydratase [Phycisphaerales bacterium]|nr:NAD(P)H-hydrate dehydratase [Phycisphaerales bacterium]